MYVVNFNFESDIFASNLNLYISILGENIIPQAMNIINDLRKLNNLSITTETNRRSLKAQMREANRQKSSYVIIIGENEIKNECVIIKNMVSSEQLEVPIKKIEKFFLKK